LRTGIQSGPDDGYEPDIVMLDGKRVRLADDGTFNFINVDRGYTISVTFKLKDETAGKADKKGKKTE